jgi:hypothetical protein
MPAGNIVYNPSSSTHSSVKKTKTNSKGTIYATVKKSKKGDIKIRGQGRKPIKRKPTKKINHTKSSNTVYAVLNLGSPKNPNKNTIKRSTRTSLKRMNNDGALVSNKRSSNRENVNKVMKPVRKARPLSKIEAQKKLNRAMESK